MTNLIHIGPSEDPPINPEVVPLHEVETPPPFRVLGWSPTSNDIYVQKRATQQTITVSGNLSKVSLLRLARKEWWYLIGEKAEDWIDYFLAEADEAGIHDTRDERGVGVWLDQDRVVWNRGNTLSVDGVERSHLDVDSEFVYLRLGAQRIAEPREFDGPQILQAICNLGWEHPAHPLYVAGFAVLSPLTGALPKRPGCDISCPTSSGKTTINQSVSVPLSGGTLLFKEGLTSAAGVYQSCGTSAHGVLVDESEQQAGKVGQMRSQLVGLRRIAYSGGEFSKGTPTGKPLSYTMSLMMGFTGINAPLPDPQDRNRAAIAKRSCLPEEQWSVAFAELQGCLDEGAGAALLYRSVEQLPVLLDNVRSFSRVVAGSVDRGDANRWGDTLGTLLAGSAWLESQTPMDDSSALNWLDRWGWEFEQAETGEDVQSEADSCLDWLLAREVPWHNQDDPDRVRTVRELYELAVGNADQSNSHAKAGEALVRLGLRATDLGLFVANRCAATDRLFASTKWANGAHRERLCELQGATDTKKRAAGDNRRGWLVPHALVVRWDAPHPDFSRFCAQNPVLASLFFIFVF